METVIIVIHLMVIVAMIAVVLMQRSEGGALGIGGGGNFMSARGQTNILTRTTAILAVAFFATSIVLTVLARLNEGPSSALDNIPASAVENNAVDGDGASSTSDIMEGLRAITDEALEPSAQEEPSGVPTSQ